MEVNDEDERFDDGDHGHPRGDRTDALALRDLVLPL
jgi:hypothetical protein